MAAVGVTSSASTVFGDKRVAMYVVTTISNNDSLITSMNYIDAVLATENQAASTANSLTVTTASNSPGTVNFGVGGTVAGAFVIVIGR
jgi:hypothetical protein